MRGRRPIRAHAITALFVLCAFPWFPCLSLAAGDYTVIAGAGEKIGLVLGKSVVIQGKTAVKRVSIAAPEIADAVVLSPRQIYLTGKNAGVTNMMMWGEGDRITAIFDIEVSPDIMALKTKLQEMFPGEKGVRVTTTGGSITLAGSASGMAKMAQIVSVAKAYAPVDKHGKPRLTNLLEVPGVRQAMPDAFNEPDDAGSYGEGGTGGREKGKKIPGLPRTTRGEGLEGEFGYILP
jgi:pilus assembly protein CpaC